MYYIHNYMCFMDVEKASNCAPRHFPGELPNPSDVDTEYSVKGKID